MYTQKQFRNENTAEVHDFIRHNGFGILVNHGDGQLFATHIPMMLSADGTRLTGHMSRGNKQARTFAQGAEVLAIFNGPHAYVSSSWYDHENVSTWNYVAVHVTGTARSVEGEELLQSLRELTAKYEKDSAKPMLVDHMSPEFLKREMAGVAAFEISITKIEATYKLSQNRDDANHAAIIHELEKRDDPGAHDVAARMKQNRPLE